MSITSMVAERFDVKPLPYGYEALSPNISEMTLTLHHDKHYAGYVAALNRLVEDTRYAHMPLEDVVLTSDGAIFNNAAQAWNHEFYFAQFSAHPKHRPEGVLLEAIVRDYGSFDEFIRRANDSATSLFGSGWVWLVLGDDNRLELTKEQNAGNPIIRDVCPLLTIDVWEHAYYCDYQNRRADAVDALWSILDWSIIERRYEPFAAMM